MSRYAKQSGALHEVTERYAKVNGVWQQVTARYVKQNGAWNQVYSSGKKLSDLPVGSLLKIAESGVPQQYIIVHQGNPDASIYDASCNGTWVFKKILLSSGYWSNTQGTDYSQSLLNNIELTMYGRFSDNIKSCIKIVKIPYAKNGTVMNLSNGFECTIFAPSVKELCGDTGWADTPDDGTKLSYFDSGSSNSAKRVFLNSSNTASAFWTRSSRFNTSPATIFAFNELGGIATFYYSNASIYVLTTMILNSTALVSSSPDSDNCYTLQ